MGEGSRVTSMTGRRSDNGSPSSGVVSNTAAPLWVRISRMRFSGRAGESSTKAPPERSTPIMEPKSAGVRGSRMPTKVSGAAQMPEREACTWAEKASSCW